ncbi:MAG: lipoprotein [Eubacterium sp.]
MKKITAFVMIIVLALGLTACGSTVGDITLESDQSAIYIQEDGTVSYAVSEKFDKDYYDEEALESKINEEVSDYNSGSKASVSDAISLNKFDVKKEVATMVLDFATTYDFFSYIKEYNRIETDKFYIGTIGDNSDCEIKADFVSPDKKTAITNKEIKQMTDSNILIVNEQYKVQIDGTVKYISDNCNVDKDGIITTAKVDDGTSYIVYTTEK